MRDKNMKVFRCYYKYRKEYKIIFRGIIYNSLIINSNRGNNSIRNKVIYKINVVFDNIEV